MLMMCLLTFNKWQFYFEYKFRAISSISRQINDIAHAKHIYQAFYTLRMMWFLGQASSVLRKIHFLTNYENTVVSVLVAHTRWKCTLFSLCWLAYICKSFQLVCFLSTSFLTTFLLMTVFIIITGIYGHDSQNRVCEA